jgi:hypothetical protein
MEKSGCSLQSGLGGAPSGTIRDCNAREMAFKEITKIVCEDTERGFEVKKKFYWALLFTFNNSKDIAF